MLIRSRANQQLKLARRVRDGREPRFIFVEGERLVTECLDTELNPHALLYLPTRTLRSAAPINLPSVLNWIILPGVCKRWLTFLVTTGSI